MSKIIDFAREHIGCPYIFGAAGQTCTPAYRQQVMKNKPLYADAIKKYCPVLSGKQSTCHGCKYEGKPSFDCRGFTRLAVKAATGRPIMGAGATSQWDDDSNWTIKGPISDIPPQPCIVFIRKENKMSHTGVYAVGSAIHASGHSAGVIESPMRSWTHYAIPVGLEGEIKLSLSKGAEGLEVQAMQAKLLALGYELGKWGADGKFGEVTEGAVKAFQTEHALPVNGVWGEAEEKLANDLKPEPIDNSALWAELEAHRARDLEIYKLLKG